MPKIGWQIDSFGHSQTLARIYSDLGYEAFMFARISTADKDQRMLDKELEFNWKTTTTENPIFTHVFYQHYNSPPGFNP